jgi:hypothetical protein
VSNPLPAPRKRRTRGHVIASQSVNYVERLLIDEGHTAQRVENDYGNDLILFTYDGFGYAEPGYVFLQLKATESIRAGSGGRDFRLSIRIEDYNLWRDEPMPVFLVLYDAAKRKAYWLYLQQYFEEDRAREPRAGARSVWLRVPAANRMSRRTIRYLRGRKQAVLDQSRGTIHHV